MHIQVTEWIEDSDIPVPVFGIAGKGDFTDEIYDNLVSNASDYDPIKHAPDIDHSPSFEINPEPYYTRKIKPIIDKDGDVISTIPHNNMTHLILTNDLYRLQSEIEKAVNKAYVLIHGSVVATKEVIECKLLVDIIYFFYFPSLIFLSFIYI